MDSNNVHFIDDDDNNKDRIEMAEELLRRSRVVVAYGRSTDENVKKEIKRLSTPSVDKSKTAVDVLNFEQLQRVFYGQNRFWLYT